MKINLAVTLAATLTLAVTLAVTLNLSDSTTYSQAPFGTKWQTSKKDLVGEIIREDSISVLTNLYVPKPESIYRSYTGYTNNSGLYAIAANTDYIKDDYFGTKGKKEFYNIIRFLELSGYKKHNSLIKSAKSQSAFYKCINQSGCNYYIWSGKDKDGNTASASISSLGDDSGYINVQYIARGFSIYG